MNTAVAITLNFKSIDAARQALLDIPASALVGYVDAEAAAPAPAPEPEAKKPAAAQKAASTQTTAKADAAPTKTAEEKNPPAASAKGDAQASTAATTEDKPKVDYPTLQKAVFALAGKSREAAAAVAASFEVKTFKELKEEQWGDALDAVNAKIAELEAA